MIKRDSLNLRIGEFVFTKLSKIEDSLLFFAIF